MQRANFHPDDVTFDTFKVYCSHRTFKFDVARADVQRPESIVSQDL
jgi:hypothetical protein